ncbi:hypothetical protein CYV26_06960 [Carnobacterium maltaromaticum]|nr:hypothetical protein [Carnobacterium maltaromaticum]PLS35133.1 hypothetical protein CYV30_09960 [Carnobacterium maltaromaticum]PLS35547.1 hypothetical protein CYV31_09940 [Carnobacterium maltaromaticum]PLS35997.1 hypothetical protein CYV33_06955 [Carnobacterium maltaromaticum]PLS42455.1 hypothetical protein CYV28_09900 [Carnobacterium maltaromaticum]PLS45475.1 hypothetical protein CYV27_06950 [Carnobacterium maltaromaticum]
MNDYYWNEYKNMMLDEEFLKETLKYQQRSIDVIKKKDDLEFKNTILNLDRVKSSDTRIQSYHFEQFPTDIQDIFEEISNSYEQFKYKVTMPILVSMSTIGDLPPGCYSFDFVNNSLILFETNLSKMNKVVTDGIILGYFLNIEDAICFYNKKAYIKGIKEIGYVSKRNQIMFDNMERLKIRDSYLPEQQLTNAMGINLTKCLLIDYLIFEVINS